MNRGWVDRGFRGWINRGLRGWARIRVGTGSTPSPFFGFLVPKRVHRTRLLPMNRHPHPALSQWERVPVGRVREDCPAHGIMAPERVH